MKKQILIIPFIAILALLGMTPEGSAYTINGNSGTYNGSDYEVVFTAYDWDTAKAEAEAQGYHLATITDMAEQDFVQTLLSPFQGEFWLGAHQDPNQVQDPSAGWSWVTGEEWSFTNWEEGEPNDWMGIQEMHLGIWGNYDWQWNDEHFNGNIKGFVMEKQSDKQSAVPVIPVPEPATIWLILGSVLAGVGTRALRRTK